MIRDLLYRQCARWLGALPVDPAGRRVFDETLADWRREGRPSRGLLAVLRGVILVAVREVRSATMRSFALRVAGWSLVWIVASLALGYIARVGADGVSPGALVLWSVLPFAFFLPASILLASMGSRARQATLGAALSTAVVAIALTGWVVPATNRAIFPGIPSPESLTRVLPPAEGASALVRGAWPVVPMEWLGNQSLPQLIARVVSGPPDGWGAMAQLSFRLSVIVLCALMPFAGLILRAQLRVWRYLGVTAVLGLVLYPTRFDALIAPDWILWMFVSCWLPVAFVATYLMMARSAFSATSSTAALPTVK